VPALIAAITLLVCSAARAREPFEDEWSPFPPPVTPAPDPHPFVVPDGLYYVTDTYVSDVTTVSGPTTSYETATVHESTGSYARVLDTVETGGASAFDGAAFNGRRTLTDGRALAGTYYENFVLTASGYVPVSVVFFQDDSETRRGETASPPPPPTTVPRPTPVPGATSRPSGPSVSSRDLSTPTPTSKVQVPLAPVGRTLRAGIALAADGPTLTSAEVLRGRLIHFWPRAFANEVAVPIRSWRLVSAHPDHISSESGGAEPLAAQWIQMPAAGVRWWLRFEVVTELAPTERLEAQISIILRSPALID
jgi:hypothetical protein